jgi:hypothetical protein
MANPPAYKDALDQGAAAIKRGDIAEGEQIPPSSPPIRPQQRAGTPLDDEVH